MISCLWPEPVGQLPHGTVGECLFEDMRSGTARFAEKISSYMEEPKLVPLDADICISGFRLTGRIDSIYPERLIKYRYTRIKPKDRLNIWFQHLFLNSLVADHYPRISMLAGLSPKARNPSGWPMNFYPWKTARKFLKTYLRNIGQGW